MARWPLLVIHSEHTLGPFMETKLTYLETKISKLLNEMSSTYTDIALREQFNTEDQEDFEFEIETDSRKEYFKELAKSVYKLCYAYMESKQLNGYLSMFINEVEPYLKDPKKTFSNSYHEESGDVYSNLISLYWSYLSAFSAFGETDHESLLKRTGIIYLQNILDSTAVILRELNITPTRESEVYKNVKLVCKATFPSSIFPSESFQKLAKCYIPDILIPSLNCAIEYKYAEDETKLINTIDEILIDVKGYENNDVYKIFFAVFYVKAGIWTRKRFEEVWKEKDFPENWKGIFIEG